jgi:hypothetical protein
MDNTIKPLQPINQKSFYNKALLLAGSWSYSRLNNVIELMSYETITAIYNKETKELRVRGYYSKTSNNHLNAFISYLNSEFKAGLKYPLYKKDIKQLEDRDFFKPFN